MIDGVVRTLCMEIHKYSYYAAWICRCRIAKVCRRKVT